MKRNLSEKKMLKRSKGAQNILSLLGRAFEVNIKSDKDFEDIPKDARFFEHQVFISTEKAALKLLITNKL